MNHISSSFWNIENLSKPETSGYYTPRERSSGGVYRNLSVRLSVRLSVQIRVRPITFLLMSRFVSRTFMIQIRP